MSPSATIPKVLTPEQVEFFHDNGYLLLPDALSPETVDELVVRIKTMLDGMSCLLLLAILQLYQQRLRLRLVIEFQTLTLSCLSRIPSGRSPNDTLLDR